MALEDRLRIDGFFRDLDFVIQAILNEEIGSRGGPVRFNVDPRWRDMSDALAFWRVGRAPFMTLLPEWMAGPAREARFEVGRLVPDYALLLQLEERATPLDGALEFVGLTGAQLDLKLAGFDQAIAFVTVESVTAWDPGPPRGSVRHRRIFEFSNGRWTLAFRSMFGDILEWANVVLGSLTTVLVALDPLKELKEALEAGLASENE